MTQILFIFELMKAFDLRIASIDDFIINDILEHFFPLLKLELF